MFSNLNYRGNPESSPFFWNRHKPPFPIRFFRENKVLSSTKKQSQEKPFDEKEFLYCASCLELITTGDQRIMMEGGYEHTFFNPGGVIFKIGCFREAPGSFAQGPATADFSWFTGFQWRVAHCGRCLQHMGWQYLQNEKTGFWGLILNQLTNKK
jgi:hypothetical protein